MTDKNFAEFKAQVKAAQTAILNYEQLPEDAIVPFSKGSDLAKSEADKIIEQPAVKERVCAWLGSISKDLDPITEKATEEIWLMAIAGTIIVPQNPFIYAWIGLLLSRAFVEAYCVEFQNKK
jgi:hypothetical protein